VATSSRLVFARSGIHSAGGQRPCDRHRAPGTYAARVSERATRELDTGDLGEFRRTGHALVDAVADHLAALPGRPVWQPLPDDLRVELLSLPLPDGPTGLGPLAGTMARDVLPYAMGNGHPAFFGWVNSPPSLAGVLASLAAAAMNPSVVSGDHADVHLERTAVRWLAELVGYPHAPGAGLLTSGASAATIVCLAGARGRAAAAAGRDVRRDGLAGGPPLLSYVPTEAHSCVPRAIELLGLGSGSIRPVPLSCGRLDSDALRVAIAADRAAGGTPALLVGSAGTVNTGAIDPLEPLAEVAAAEGLWFHVDGAYGAFGVLDPAIAARYRGMERADSLTLDPHKWLGVPGHLRRVRPGADAAVPRPEDVGDDRRPWSRRHRRSGRPRERAGARARRADRARAIARARGRPGDVDRGVQGPPARLPAGSARGHQPHAPRDSPGARAGVRDRHRL
jgi:hypothetical protein